MGGTPEDVLGSVFGYTEFRPGQREIIDNLLAGTHTLAVMPTGAGKSLCYQIPALVMGRLVVVVSPLVALMDDQVAGLEASGVAAARIHSGRTRADNVADWRRVQQGEVNLLYLSPERLMTERMLAALGTLDPAMFVVDEAHCISKWGVSFRPEYEALSDLRGRFPGVTLAGFTATADAATRRDVADKLFDGDGAVVVQGFDRPNLRLGVTPKADWRRQLLAFLEPRRAMSGVVYCLSRRLTEQVAAFLMDQGYVALPYHAGLAPEARRENQEAFMAGGAVVMVATVAFGMGIDKPDIRFVFHLNLPGNMETYYQEIGRAGRDGLPAEVQMIYGLDDIRMRRQFIEQEGENAAHALREHKRLDGLLAYCEATQCRRVTLLAYFGDDATPCGNCDICLDPPTVIDGTAQAQLLLSAVKDTGQRFGTAHVIDVVRGTASDKATQWGHDRLACFGGGAAQSKRFWQGFARQVVAGGYLAIDIEGFGGLRLTDKGGAVLAGSQGFHYREIHDVPAKTRKARVSVDIPMDDIDQDLLARLKGLRRDLAQQRGVPAYVIFSDASLHEMCGRRPATPEQFLAVSGVGPKKLQDFGDVFLRAIGEAAA